MRVGVLLDRGVDKDRTVIEKIETEAVTLLLENILIDRDGLHLNIYRIYPRRGQNPYKAIGRLTIRLGESEEVGYLGNLGYSVNKKSRGKGYATAACQGVIDFLKRQGITYLTITTNNDNAPSQQVCEKLGGVLVGEVIVKRTMKTNGTGQVITPCVKRVYRIILN